MILLAGHHSFFVVYDYNTNYIFTEPVSNITYATIVGAFNKVFKELTDTGVKPRFNVTVNQATGPLKSYMVKHDCKCQFLEPSSHSVNATERAIQALKNTIISDMCSSDTRWPVHLWDHLGINAGSNHYQSAAHVTQQHSHTIMSPTAWPHIYHQLYGHKYDLNVNPMAPQWFRAIIYVDPTIW